MVDLTDGARGSTVCNSLQAPYRGRLASPSKKQETAVYRDGAPHSPVQEWTKRASTSHSKHESEGGHCPFIIKYSSLLPRCLPQPLPLIPHLSCRNPEWAIAASLLRLARSCAEPQDAFHSRVGRQLLLLIARADLGARGDLLLLVALVLHGLNLERNTKLSVLYTKNGV